MTVAVTPSCRGDDLDLVRDGEECRSPELLLVAAHSPTFSMSSGLQVSTTSVRQSTSSVLPCTRHQSAAAVSTAALTSAVAAAPVAASNLGLGALGA